MMPSGTELVIPFDAGGERVGVLLLGARLNGTPYGRAERDLASTLAFAGAIGRRQQGFELGDAGFEPRNVRFESGDISVTWIGLRSIGVHAAGIIGNRASGTLNKYMV